MSIDEVTKAEIKKELQEISQQLIELNKTSEYLAEAIHRLADHLA